MADREYVVSIPIPEDALDTCALLIVQYFDTDGNARYAVGTRGEALMTTYMGLTVAAQGELREMSRRDNGGD